MVQWDWRNLKQTTGNGRRIWAKQWLGNTIWANFEPPLPLRTQLARGPAEDLYGEYAGLRKKKYNALAPELSDDIQGKVL